jgi:hypothetical protein
MDNVHHYRAWRWVFILEVSSIHSTSLAIIAQLKRLIAQGIPTILLAIVAGIFLPNDTQSARFLSEDEKALCLHRFAADQANLAPIEKAGKVDWEQVRAAFKDWKVWAMSFSQMGNTAMLYTYSVFLVSRVAALPRPAVRSDLSDSHNQPTIIRGLGFSSYQVQLLTIPCYFMGALSFCVTAHFSDKLSWRGPFTVLGHLISVLGYAVVLGCGVSGAGAGGQYAGCIIIAMGLYTAVGLPLSWNGKLLAQDRRRRRD